MLAESVKAREHLWIAIATVTYAATQELLVNVLSNWNVAGHSVQAPRRNGDLKIYRFFILTFSVYQFNHNIYSDQLTVYFNKIYHFPRTNTINNLNYNENDVSHNCQNFHKGTDTLNIFFLLYAHNKGLRCIVIQIIHITIVHLRDRVFFILVPIVHFHKNRHIKQTYGQTEQICDVLNQFMANKLGELQTFHSIFASFLQRQYVCATKSLCSH